MYSVSWKYSVSKKPGFLKKTGQFRLKKPWNLEKKNFTKEPWILNNFYMSKVVKFWFDIKIYFIDKTLLWSSKTIIVKKTHLIKV